MSERHLRFQTADVFTQSGFAGNPLAVVFDADGLTDQQMQTIAREFNLSETVFVQTPREECETARVRIFTPAKELPFAGHPTVGACVLLAKSIAEQEGGAAQQKIILHEQAGLVPVEVDLAAGGDGFGELVAPGSARRLKPQSNTELLVNALGLAAEKIGFDNHRPSRYSAGVPFYFVPLADLESVAQAQIVPAPWDDAFGADDHNSVYVYCRRGRHAHSAFHARMFAPNMGIGEDPATGAAVAAFAGVVHEFEQLDGTAFTGWIEQGYEMGRPSQIKLSLKLAEGKIDQIRVGGYAVQLAEGWIAV